MTEADPLDDSDLPLGELRRAWSEVGAPRPDVELGESDARTRAAVEWMRSAWRRVEAPVVPLAPSQRASRRWTLPRAMAAGALLALGLWVALQRSMPGVRPEDMQPEFAAVEPSPGAPHPGAQRFARGVQVAALAPDRVELCSGSVCLILLTPDAAPRTP